MELLGKLGIDIPLLLAQIINFGILLLIFTKFVYKPIIKRIEEEESALNQAEIKKEQLVQKQSTIKQQTQDQQVHAKERARQIITEAEEIAAQIKKKAQQEADEEKAAVIKQIKSRLEETTNAPQNSEKN